MSVTHFTAKEISDLETKSTTPRFLHSLFGSAAIMALALQWPTTAWPFVVGCTLVAAYSMFCWSSCFHETSHQGICGKPWVSIWLGRAIGTMLFVSYTAYREAHIRHHAYLNKPGDWELWPYSDPTTSLTFRRIFCWLELPLGFVTSPFVYSRLCFSRNTPVKNPKVMKTMRIEYAVMAVVWAGILGAVAWYSVWVPFLMAWVIPHWIASVIQTFRKYTEHLGMQSYDPLLGTRTVIGSNLITRICTYINFDIFVHGPHHRHPKIAHNKLVEKMDNYQADNPDTKYPVFTTYMSAIKHTLPALWNPGVGMNVGAPAPKKEKWLGADNFVTDVAREILSDRDVSKAHRAS
ncbi:fatty acid desaturase family protein [Gimesia sp.]|uniref:fatty acid desaturase family protein n=1 Tax=Gimesia sp. TaxID=2024833 RepID=UPI003A8E386C